MTTHPHEEAFGRRIEDEFAPRILSNEEIEMYIKGDRREVDKLILFSLNRLAACIIPHARREDERDLERDKLLADLGGTDIMIKRAAYVDTVIKQAETKTRMMEKVTASSLGWALIAFLGFIAVASWEYVLQIVSFRT